ncbi:unnamed protein product [Kuraishia capsulata CBS 1993]|uniref:Pre-mRNA-splicing factor CLF1 n=1 Tax=Kuraishia capsulata CBS 1993 TaxID=1382522 RepID=W6MPK0_9ASCO|nr:uncharacterized protein KUCA_T00004539001 [Kuraishia capsulata CBS 1993]CDK28556.1 unnamed protein product [Kuraishia capsulata CBS 1993]
MEQLAQKEDQEKALIARFKAPAQKQITAEQILLEAYESRDKPQQSKPEYKLTDLEELHEFQRRKRTEYENALRVKRLDIGQWKRYANFEIEQHDFNRARSIFERALEVDHANVPLWIRYAQVEISGRNINHARNVLERGVTILPMVYKLWYQYISVEESIGDVLGVRALFERWLKYKPGKEAWGAYVNFETRYRQFDRARLIYERFVVAYPEWESWNRWIQFERTYGSEENIRTVYKLSFSSMKEIGRVSGEQIISWCEWESSAGYVTKARELFQWALKTLSGDDRSTVYDGYSKFEKQYGDREGIEFVILQKRKQKYLKSLEEDKRDYDAWWALFNLLQGDHTVTTDEVRSFYKDALASSPDSHRKDDWRRYIYLPIRYAVWEELTENSEENARGVYESILKLIPHRTFTFAKVWISYAEFEIRNNNLAKARKILGRSLGICPKKKLYKYYIEFETQMKDFDRVRKIYEKFLENFPTDADVWINFANLEGMLGEETRLGAIYDLAYDELDSKSDKRKVWLAFIDHEVEESDFDKARHLYGKLLEDNKSDPQTWISAALFELSLPSDEQLLDYQQNGEEEGFEFDVSEAAKDKARAIFEAGLKTFKKTSATESRITLLEAFKQFEEIYGNEETLEAISKRLPSVVKKIRTIDGTQEEYNDYVFPDDKSMSEFMKNAKKWMLASKK